MSSNGQAEYYIAKQEEPTERKLSVFYVPAGDGLSIPKEIVRIKSIDVASQGLWETITGRQLEIREAVQPTIEPSSIEGIGNVFREFMKANVRGGVFVHDDTPQEVKDALNSANEAMRTGPGTSAADFLGIQLENQTPVSGSDNLKTGFYL